MKLGRGHADSDGEVESDAGLEDTPVLGLTGGDADSDDDDAFSDEDEEIAESDDESDDDAEDAAAARRAAVSKEDAVLSAWGSKKSAYYAHDADVEIDEEAAAAEEEEALRMQRQRAAELDDGDVALGVAVAAGATSASAMSKQRQGAGEKSGKRGRAAEGGVEVVGKQLGELSRQEKLDIVMADTPELLGLVAELRERVAEVRQVLQPALDASAAAGSKAPAAGVSYLQVKQQLLLAYLSAITFYLLLKAEGRPVADHPVIAELVRLRALLDRLRPLDVKMAPTVARLVKLAGGAAAAAGGKGVAATGGKAAAGSARPNPAALLAHGQERRKAGKATLRGGDDDDDEAAAGSDADSGAEGAAEGEGAYVPLRRVAVAYDADPAAAKAARQAERKQKHGSRSALLADLRAAYSEAPEESGAAGGAEAAVDPRGAAADESLARVAEERRRYEEDAFTRLQPSREERKARKAREKERGRWDALAELEHYGDLAAAGTEEAEEGAPSDSRGKGGRGTAAVAAGSAAALSRLAAATRGRPVPAGVAALSQQLSGGKRRRAGDGDDAEDGGESSGGEAAEDPFYAAVAAAAARKKARRADAAEAVAEGEREYMRGMRDEEALDLDASGGHRKASREIIANRGLTKYRKKDDKNPRVNYRRKAAEAVKRRKGQVVPMRSAGAEAGRYAGEVTGIRAGVSHSRKIRA